MIAIVDVDVRVLELRTRLPFRYGITEMTRAPHVVVDVTAEVAGRRVHGYAAENLPPKWFTKDPARPVAEEVREMAAVVLSAADLAVGAEASTVFQVWRDLDRAQRAAADARRPSWPGLLATLGTSLVERALIDAFCRAEGTTLRQAVRGGGLGIDLGVLHPELADRDVASLLPAHSTTRIGIRHTVGLADPIDETDAVPVRPDDGLPVTVEEAIAHDGLRYLKIKTEGRAAADVERLRRIFAVLGTDRSVQVTIDANESFSRSEEFRDWWSALVDSAPGPELIDRLIVVEQPFARAVALTPAVREATQWPSCPPLIIDESDGTDDALRRALDLGYAGGTYKGCKGVFRAIANRCLLTHRDPRGERLVMTAEDLATVPPLSVTQDLAVASLLGIEHVERNGHHYFGRIAPIGGTGTDELLLEAHGDAFARDTAAAARLRIDDGSVDIGTLLRAPFGCSPTFDLSALPHLSRHLAATA